MSRLLLKVLGISEDGDPRAEVSPETRMNIAASIFLIDACYGIPQCGNQKRGYIVGIILSTFPLPEPLIEELINMSHVSQARHLDLSQFKNQINDVFTSEERIAIIEKSWKVIYSDEGLGKYEELFAEHIKSFFMVPDNDLSEARKRVKEGK